jgi:hypothetical protein
MTQSNTHPILLNEPPPLTSLESKGNGVEAVAAPAGDPNPAASQPGLHMGRSLAQIVVLLVVVLMLVNIPFKNYSAGLIQLIPQATSMVIYDGMLLKGSKPDIYVMEDYKLRRIVGPEAFQHFFRGRQVNRVEDSALQQFAQGQPIFELMQCPGSPDVYALENGLKRWVKDPPSNPAKQWDQTETVACDYLRLLPDGAPIPEDAGPPPQP